MMPTTNDISIKNLKLKIVPYGKSGFGKTHFAGTFPKPYFFDFDKGMLTLRDKAIEYDTYQDLYRNGVKYQSGWKGVQKVLGRFEQGVFKGLDDRELSYVPETLVFDSLTTLVQYIASDVASLNGHMSPQWEDWGKTVQPVIDFFKRINALDFHAVLVAHEDLLKDDILGNIVYRPYAFGKKIPSEICVYFDEVYRLNVEEKGGEQEYTMRTAAGSMYTAKSRLGLDPLMDPTYDAIMKCLSAKE